MTSPVTDKVEPVPLPTDSFLNTKRHYFTRRRGCWPKVGQWDNPNCCTSPTCYLSYSADLPLNVQDLFKNPLRIPGIHHLACQ